MERVIVISLEGKREKKVIAIGDKNRVWIWETRYFFLSN